MSNMKIRYATRSLIEYVGKTNSPDELQHFETKYRDSVREYDKSGYALRSTGIYLSELESVKKWIPELVQNKDKIIPMLIAKMISVGDMFAESLYNAIQKSSGNEDLIVTGRKIHIDNSLRILDEEEGFTGPSKARINAEYWLTTEDAAQILGSNDQGKEVLCLANSLLGLHNDYIECK